MNKIKKNLQTQRADRLLPERRGVGGLGERDEGIKYQLVVTKWSQRCKAHHRE